MKRKVVSVLLLLAVLTGCGAQDATSSKDHIDVPPISPTESQGGVVDTEKPVVDDLPSIEDSPHEVNVQLPVHDISEYGFVSDLDAQTIHLTGDSALPHSDSSIYPMFKHLNDMTEEDAVAYVTSVAEVAKNLDNWYLYNVYNTSYKPEPEDKTAVQYDNLSAGGFTVWYNHPGGYVWRMDADNNSIGEINQRFSWETCYYNSEFQQIQSTLVDMSFPLAENENILNYDVEYFTDFITEVTGRDIPVEMVWSMLVHASENLMVSENDDKFSWREVFATFGEEGGDYTRISVVYKETVGYQGNVYKSVDITVWDSYI